MTCLHLYFTGSTEAGFRGGFTTAYHKENLKICQKRTPIYIAKYIDIAMPNSLGKMRRIFLSMFEDKKKKERTQKNNTRKEIGKGKTSILKNMSIPKKTVFLRIGKKSKFIMTQNRFKTGQKGKRDRRFVKKNSLFSKRGKLDNMKTITLVKLIL